MAACKVHHVKCSEHGYVHGGEAEELRKGVENLIAEAEHECSNERYVLVEDLRRLLDRIDARDSLAFLDADDVRRTRHRRAV